PLPAERRSPPFTRRASVVLVRVGALVAVAAWAAPASASATVAAAAAAPSAAVTAASAAAAFAGCGRLVLFAAVLEDHGLAAALDLAGEVNVDDLELELVADL